MKKRHIFIIGLIALLLACPSCMIYITVKQQESYKKKVINGIDPYRIQLLSMAVESKTNPDYSPLIFNGTDELGQEAANDAINKIFDALLEMEQSDDGFYYIAYNTKTKQYYKNEKSHYPVIYKQTSTIAKDQKFNDFNLREILEDTEIVHRLDDNYKLMDDGRLKVKDVYINLDQITINPPNIELTYYCTVYVSPMTNNISRFIDDYDVAVLAGIASLLGLILFIYIIMNSLEVEESINPYRTIKNWKLLTVLILIGLTCFVFIGVSTGTGIFVITGELQNVLARHGVAYGTSISYGLYFFSMFIFYFLFSMLCFTVKYMFMNGMNYFKNNTCTYALYEKTKELGNRVTEFDLKDNINQDILKFTICNALLVIVLYVLSPSKTIFAIVYIMISFLYIRKQSMKVKNDYKNMLNFTEQLSHGHFDTEIENDLGIFNSMRDRLNNLKTGFEAAVKEETKSQNMKTELITNVSHDLKTPLTCIKNYVILLKNTQADETTRTEYLNQLEKYTNRLSNLIQDLFDVSKATSGNIDLHPIDLRLQALVDQSLAECIEVLESKDIQVIKNVEDVVVHLDGDKTYRVFENLLTNIGKYAMPHSRAYIDIHEEEDYVSLIFKNMSEVEMNFSSEEIQERFVRGDKSRHETGSGLGLAIAKSFVVAQGGTFDIEIDGDLFKVIMTFKKNKCVK
ncbi:MAG: histidine kinase dimerization/phospho-acceptor domain-containing protein [Catenibacterium mitsuokai]|nr:histidine kinase dimerization/phospho-acceptor domain-containing protein [Catenibacterium mitsuokai]MDD6595937.1 histidine kinase dimerization/phospho-acceptor domain-containing protein [Catenibacterium mitsuokai]